MAAGALGTWLATFGVAALVRLAPADLPRIADAAVNLRVLAVTLLVTLGAGFAFGLVPLLQAQRVDLQDALKQARGNRAVAARLLRTTRRIFNYKVKNHGIDWRRFE